MNFIQKALKPTSLFLAVLFLLAPAYYQTISAAMIGTEVVLTPDSRQQARDRLKDLMSREDIQKVLAARGINPLEASARIDTLTEEELELISRKMADLPAGGDATGFVIVVAAVIIIVLIIVEYFSEVKMFPQLYSDE